MTILIYVLNILREFVGLGLLSNSALGAKRLGVSPDCGIGVCCHVGNKRNEQLLVPESHAAVVNSANQSEKIFDEPGTLIEVAACTLVNH